MNKENITGYILAGGKSSRMGSDKGLIVFNNKTLIEQVINQLKPAVNNIIIVSGNKEYSQFGYEVIEDTYPNTGPAGGIHAALKHTASNHNFIVSCDMPFITTDAIEYVINNSLLHPITLPVHHTKFEPLFAVYSKDCFTKWEELLTNNTRKLTDIIDHFNVLKLNVDTNPLFNESIFVNINSQEDLQKAIDITASFGR